ncbi:hypothetical protein [Kyrpidia sp.]|uniref:hypothetical protein n=1 Tax=Kyrpidia sp. TaxID=2073077 RepID=UPI00258296A7|nr:hypothetical protein [Kyrpidia sp.]MCL6574855.1 hypothetical protein [Kyrpidia sp.]
MNDFEKEIRRAFDRMFNEIEVPPAESIVGRIERKQQQRRTKRYIVTGISAAAAAGLIAMVSVPHLDGTFRNPSVAYNAPPGTTRAPVTPNPTKPGSTQATPGLGTQSPEKAGVSQQGAGDAPGGSPGHRVGDSGSVSKGALAMGGARGTLSTDNPGASGSPSKEGQPSATNEAPAPSTQGKPSEPSSGSVVGLNQQDKSQIVLPSARAIRWTPYQPSFIPAGYVPVVEFASATAAPNGGKPPVGVRWTYQGPDDAILIIAQQPLEPNAASPLPVSPYPQEQTTVHGQAAVFQRGSDNLLHLIWVENGIRFDIATNTDKQTLLQVATGLAP